MQLYTLFTCSWVCECVYVCVCTRSKVFIIAGKHMWVIGDLETKCLPILLPGYWFWPCVWLEGNWAVTSLEMWGNNGCLSLQQTDHLIKIKPATEPTKRLHTLSITTTTEQTSPSERWLVRLTCRWEILACTQLAIKLQNTSSDVSQRVKESKAASVCWSKFEDLLMCKKSTKGNQQEPQEVPVCGFQNVQILDTSH